MADRHLEGFHYSCDEDVLIAEDELKKIKYISEKMNMNNADSVLKVYNKSVQTNLFNSPVGIEFLRRMQHFLINSGKVSQEEILDIPISYSISDAIELKANNRYKNIDTPTKNYEFSFRMSVFGNVCLGILVIAMFLILLTGKNANILNYRNAIVNEYSEWEQDLTEREKIIREKEATLNLDK